MFSTEIRDYSGNILTDPDDIARIQELAFEDYQIEQMEKQIVTEQRTCERLRQIGLDCDICRPVVCTKDEKCLCPKCLDIPF